MRRVVRNSHWTNPYLAVASLACYSAIVRIEGPYQPMMLAIGQYRGTLPRQIWQNGQASARGRNSIRQNAHPALPMRSANRAGVCGIVRRR